VKRIACLFGLLLFAGCSTSQRDWDRLANAPASKGAGREAAKATFPVIATDCDASSAAAGSKPSWLALTPVYGKIFSFGYIVPLRTEQHGNRHDFSGEANLGWFAGGRYSYRGSATATNSLSICRCKSDHGTFEMHRPPVR